MGNCRSRRNTVDGKNKNQQQQNSDIPENDNKDLIRLRIHKNLDSSPVTTTTTMNINNHDKETKTINDDVIGSTKEEVYCLLELVQEFEGTTENDKNYRYLDEMLMRCILRLDKIECNNAQERNDRKEAISGVNQAISILERKLQINSEIRELASKLNVM